MAPPDWTGSLPALNASLNGTCACLLAAGFLFIRRGRVAAHRTCMKLRDGSSQPPAE